MTSSLSNRKFMAGLAGIGIMLVLAVPVCGCTQPAVPVPTRTTVTTPTSAGMPNPASVACVQAGGSVEIKKDASGQ